MGIGYTAAPSLSSLSVQNQRGNADWFAEYIICSPSEHRFDRCMNHQPRSFSRGTCRVLWLRGLRCMNGSHLQKSASVGSCVGSRVLWAFQSQANRGLTWIGIGDSEANRNLLTCHSFP